MYTKANDAPCELIHDHEHPMCLEQNRLTPKQIDTPEAIFHMANESQPGRTSIGIGGRVVVVGQNPKACRYLVKDFGTSKSPKSTRQRGNLLCPGRPAVNARLDKKTPSPTSPTNGFTACRMSVQIFSAGYGKKPSATAKIRPYLRLPGTTRLVLRTSMAGSA